MVVFLIFWGGGGGVGCLDREERGRGGKGYKLGSGLVVFLGREGGGGNEMKKSERKGILDWNWVNDLVYFFDGFFGGIVREGLISFGFDEMLFFICVRRIKGANNNKRVIFHFFLRETFPFNYNRMDYLCSSSPTP